MEEWINHIARSVDCEPRVARLALGHVLSFLQQRFPNGPGQELVSKIPGARELVAEADATPTRRGFVSGVLGGVGNMFGQKGEVLALSSKLTSMGLSPHQLQRLAREIFGGAELVIGRPKLQSMTDTIPGLTHFLWPKG